MMKKDRQRYTRYTTWALETCGLTDTAFRDCLKASKVLQKENRGKAALPKAFELSRRSGRIEAVRHALCLCRVTGLRRVAASPELEDLCTDGADEMDRLLSLESVALEQEYGLFSARLRGPQGLNLPAATEIAEHAPRALVGLFSYGSLHKAPRG